MKKVLAMAAIALFMMTSCSDDSSDATNNGNDTVLVKKMIETISGESTTYTLTYDGNKLLSLVSDNDTHTDFTYANDLLVKEESFNGTETYYKLLYQYDSNKKLTSSIEFSLYMDTIYATKNVYTYNSNGTITVTVYTGDENAQTDLDGTGIVTLINGNITKYIFTPTESSAEITTSTFDTKNSPFKNVFAEDVMTLAVLEGGNNNILTNNRGDGQSFRYEYIYNDAGYPTKETSFWDGILEYETQYFYE
ncbi:hypothetical protein ACX0HA_05530 [Flavobacterium hauense]